MCKSVQSSFDNCSINTVYLCTLKLKWLGKGLLSLTKYGPISRTAVFLVYSQKRYLMKYVMFMGTKKLSFSSVTRWCKKFKSGVDSVKDAPHARCPKTATSQKIVEKVKNLVATYARFTTRHIAKCVSISVGAAHTILRRDLKMRRISARWIPHLLTKEQKLARVRIVKQLLKQRKPKTLHSKMHHEHQKGNVCNFLYKSRSCYSDCCTKG